MEIRYPAYYEEFYCLAGACPDSCCKQWAVVVDDASALQYRQLPNALGDELRRFLREEDGQTVLSLLPDGHCPMWREDGLCRIQAELGEGSLCETCRQFPRLRHDYGDFVELGLELSCPEAARLILADRGQAFVTRQVSGGEEPEYDAGAMAILLRTRAEILAFLGREEYPVGTALAVLLLYGYAVQAELDGEDPAVLDPTADLARAHQLAVKGSIEDILSFYKGLEILSAEWENRLGMPVGSQWSDALRAMARYFVQRYWLQAVSDYDIVGRVKLVVVSCLVVKALGGDVPQTAQQYSKEIENDADNVDALLDAAYKALGMADRGLLGLLLEV